MQWIKVGVTFTLLATSNFLFAQKDITKGDRRAACTLKFKNVPVLCWEYLKTTETMLIGMKGSCDMQNSPEQNKNGMSSQWAAGESCSRTGSVGSCAYSIGVDTIQVSYRGMEKTEDEARTRGRKACDTVRGKWQ